MNEEVSIGRQAINRSEWVPAVGTRPGIYVLRRAESENKPSDWIVSKQRIFQTLRPHCQNASQVQLLEHFFGSEETQMTKAEKEIHQARRLMQFVEDQVRSMSKEARTKLTLDLYSWLKPEVEKLLRGRKK